MVAPTAFTFNQQAAADNRFMHSGSEASSASDVGSRVLAEHNGLHEKLSNVRPFAGVWDLSRGQTKP